jgi:hypothetical protein
VLADHAHPAEPDGPEGEPRLDWANDDSGRRKLRNQTDGLLGSFTAQVVLGDVGLGWDQPVVDDAWQTEEAWKLDVVGPFSVFGQVGAGCVLTHVEDLKLSGRTGLAWKLPALLGGEVLLRGGPGVTYVDALRQTVGQGRPEVLVEVQGHWPLFGALGLEFQGSAAPALLPTDHDRLDQDVRLALPLGKVGRLRVGAKHSWENLTIPRPGSDTMQLYLNFSVGP